MAQTWTNTPVLKKIKIGDATYWVKDNDARAILDTYSALPTYPVASSVSDTTANAVATAAQVKTYVDNATAAINKFDVRVYETLPTASKDTMYILALVADATSETGSYVEYITVRTGTDPDYSYAWERIGTTQADLTEYVKKTTTIAGLDLQDNITDTELKTALGLGALAYKSSAEGTITTVDSAKFTYQPEGTVALTAGTANLESTGVYTPAGTISIDFSQTATAATLTKGDYTPEGTVSVALTGNTFDTIDSVGTTPTFSEGAFTAATITYSGDTFAKEGVVATIGTGADAETLVLTSATTGAASNITAFNGGSKAADTFTAGTVPTKKSTTVGVGTSTFTGTTATNALVTGVSYDKASSNGATFVGTEATIDVAGVYNTVTTATFTGTTITDKTVTLTTSAKTVTVY